MTYKEALAYLDSFVNYEKKDSYDYSGSFKLDRMVRLASLLQDPQKSLRSVHVAGTKGKGSTCAMIHSILKEAGYRAGLYTSPHLVSFRERIRIGDELISKEDVGVFMDVVKRGVDGLGDDRPTFFEVYTALAFAYFRDKGADPVIFETGLGGRLDATNMIEPLVSVITPISRDHTDMLGDTVSKIAFEKAGIIKPGSVCVSAPQDDDALEVIRKACDERESSLVLVGRDVTFEETKADDSGEVFSVKGLFGGYKDLHMGLLGRHQVVNAAAAIGAVESLRLSGVTVSPESVRRGLGSVRWPGRLETVKGSPRVVLDGAQNGASAAALSSAVRRLFKYRKLVLVLGVSKDKDIKGVLKELIPIADSVVVTRSSVAERAMDPSLISGMITPKEIGVAVTTCAREAMEKAFSIAAPQDLVLVTGSLFLVGEIRRILLKEETDE